jgi:hypothetical protein
MPPPPLRARTRPVPLARTNHPICPIREPRTGHLHAASAPSSRRLSPPRDRCPVHPLLIQRPLPLQSPSLPHDHGVLVGALLALLRVEARHRASAFAAQPLGDPRELILCHLPRSSGQLLPTSAGRALLALVVPLSPRRWAIAGGGGLGGEAGAHDGQREGSDTVGHMVEVAVVAACLPVCKLF